MQNEFYYNLTQYLKTRDNINANRVIMTELANILLKDRESFITLLKYADVPVYDIGSDAALIDAFIDNINKNRKLMIGSAFLINQKNKHIGFDGEEEISDAGVKAVHKVMFNYFDAAPPVYSNAGGLADAIGAIAQAGGQIGGQALEMQNKKKYGAQDLLHKKMDAKQTMINTVLEQRTKDKAAQEKKAAAKAKLKKILIISSVSLVGLAVVIGGIYLIRKKLKS